MSDPRTRQRAALSAAVGFVGVLLLALFAERAAQPWARPLALVGVIATSVGAAYAAGLLVAPAPRALFLRHLAAGGAAAWLARELASTAARLGLEGTSDAFRVFWAPTSEEACKALLLAAVWTQGDDRRDRREVVTAAVGVGVGFAIRENFVYFANALGQQGVALEWIALRAVPPVLAHAAFGLILGGTIAQGAIHARVCGEPVRRVSLLGACVAVGAHVAYNGVALLLTRGIETYAVETAAAWSLCAAGMAAWLRARTLRAAAEDQPVVTTLVPTPDRTRAHALGYAAVAFALLALPLAATRSLGAVCAPLAVGALAATTVAAATRQPRALTPLLLGVAARPLVRALELSVAVLDRAPPVVGGGVTKHVALAVLGHACWLGATAHAARVWGGPRGRNAAVAFAVAIAAGMAGADLGVTLTALAPNEALRALALGVPRAIPTTLALGALVGRLGYRSAARAWGATALAAALAAGLDLLARHFHGAPGALLAAAAGTAALATLVHDGVRRTRAEATAGATRTPAPRLAAGP